MTDSLELALEHGFTESQWRKSKNIESQIFGPYQWEDQEDRAASMVVAVLNALRDENAEVSTKCRERIRSLLYAIDYQIKQTGDNRCVMIQFDAAEIDELRKLAAVIEEDQ